MRKMIEYRHKLGLTGDIMSVCSSAAMGAASQVQDFDVLGICYLLISIVRENDNKS